MHGNNKVKEERLQDTRMTNVLYFEYLQIEFRRFFKTSVEKDPNVGPYYFL